MKKTFTINLGGIVFHIDEDAFDKLNQYLKSISNHFSSIAGGNEIIADIEARIAELFQEKTNSYKQVITLIEVDQAIQAMGNPKDFLGEGEEQTKTEQQSTDNRYYHTKRKIYRDPDDRVLGGVCSGLGNYFDIESVWIRLVFAIAFFVFGSGFLIYIILWIILPKAITPSQKLEMKGEPINVENIKKSVVEELNEINGAKIGSSISAFFDKMGGFLTTVFSSLFRIISSAFGVLNILIGILLMIVLVMVVQELWINEYILCIGLLLLIGIPLVSMIYCGLKLILKIKNKNKALRITSFSLWIIGLIIVATSGIDIAKRFTYQKTTFDTVFLQPTKSPKIIITSSDNNKINGATKSYIGWSSEEEEENFGINISGFLWKEDTIRMRPFLKIVRSTDDSLMSLVVKKYARGESAKQALSLTEKISYQFTQKDSLIDFSSYSQTLKSDSWRFQHVKLILQIPVGKTIFIDRSMKHIIYDVENVKNIADSDMLDKNWMMTEKGLVCIDCTGNESIVDEED